MKKTLLASLLIAMMACPTWARPFKSNTLTMGDGANTNKQIAVDIGTANVPTIRWNASATQWEVSIDGSTFIPIGSGGGGGASGVNVLNAQNFDIELGHDKIWSTTGGAVATEETTVGNGSKSFSWDASALNQRVDSPAINLSKFERLHNKSCVVSLWYKATTISSGDYKLESYDGSNVIGTVDLLPTVEARGYENILATFPCPDTGTIQMRLVAGIADPDAILFDDVFLGELTLVDVSQTEHVAHAFFAETTGCRWQRTNTALGDFGADVQCPAITVVSSNYSVDATDTDLPQIVFPQLPAGTYKVEAQMTYGVSAVSALDVAISDGTDTRGVQGDSPSGIVPNERPQVESTGVFTYTSAGARTFKIQGASTSGTLSLINDISASQLTFTVTRYPLGSEKAFRIDTVNRFGSIVWEGGASKTDTIPGASWETFSNANFATGRTLIGSAVDPTSTNDIAIKLLNLPAGTYKVTASGGRLAATDTVNDTNATTCNVGIYDGTTRRGKTEIVASDSDGSPHFNSVGSIHGIFEYSDFGDREFAVQGYLTGGETCGLAFATANDGFEMTVESMDQQKPAPNIVNGVVNPRLGVTNVPSSKLNCDSGSSILSDDGFVSSIGNISSGACAVTLDTVFKSAPRCEFTIDSASLDVDAHVNVTSPTAVSIIGITPSTGLALASFDGHLWCTEEKQ